MCLLEDSLREEEIEFVICLLQLFFKKYHNKYLVLIVL